jgi:hypothetical protein
LTEQESFVELLVLLHDSNRPLLQGNIFGINLQKKKGHLPVEEFQMSKEKILSPC